MVSCQYHVAEAGWNASLGVQLLSFVESYLLLMLAIIILQLAIHRGGRVISSSSFPLCHVTTNCIQDLPSLYLIATNCIQNMQHTHHSLARYDDQVRYQHYRYIS